MAAFRQAGLRRWTLAPKAEEVLPPGFRSLLNAITHQKASAMADGARPCADWRARGVYDLVQILGRASMFRSPRVESTAVSHHQQLRLVPGISFNRPETRRRRAWASTLATEAHLDACSSADQCPHRHLYVPAAFPQARASFKRSQAPSHCAARLQSRRRGHAQLRSPTSTNRTTMIQKSARHPSHEDCPSSRRRFHSNTATCGTTERDRATTSRRSWSVRCVMCCECRHLGYDDLDGLRTNTRT